jgi:hypothetical protein
MSLGTPSSWAWTKKQPSQLSPTRAPAARTSKLWKVQARAGNGAMSRDDRTVGLDPRYFPTGAVLERSVTQRPSHENPPFRRYLHDTGKSLFVWDCVVADAVAVEPVSDTIFRHNSEKYRENRIENRINIQNPRPHRRVMQHPCRFLTISSGKNNREPVSA